MSCETCTPYAGGDVILQRIYIWGVDDGEVNIFPFDIDLSSKFSANVSIYEADMEDFVVSFRWDISNRYMNEINSYNWILRRQNIEMT